MLIDFIGWAILCGVGLGGLLILVLMPLRKAISQRTKWTMMLGSVSLTALIAVILSLYVALSPTQAEQLQQEFQSIPNLDQSVQWYEYTYTSSSATGKCGNISTHRWFGLNTGDDGQIVMDWYMQQLADNGWQFENNVWRKNTSQGIFSLNIEVFTNTAKIDLQQWSYTITDDALQQALHYPTAYVLRLNLTYRESFARCFRQ